MKRFGGNPFICGTPFKFLFELIAKRLIFMLFWLDLYRRGGIVSLTIVSIVWYESRMLIGVGEKTEVTTAFPKADLLNRFIAKFVDFLVVAFLYEIPFQISFLLGMVYLFIADGFVTGSVGKRLIGLHIVFKENHKEISFRESIVRNIPFGLAYLTYPIPFIGWLIAAGIVSFESFLMIGNPNGMRLGDEMAKTFVADIRMTRHSQEQ